MPANSFGPKPGSPCDDDRRCCKHCEWNPWNRAMKEVKREKGFLYYIGNDGYVWATPMKHNTTGMKHKVGTVQITEEERKCMGLEFVEKRYFDKEKEV